MNAASGTPRSPLKTTLLVLAGVVFAVCWIAVHVAWATMALTADLMANDAGRADGFQWGTLIVGMLAGQCLAGAAGIPGGAAFFWRRRRRLMLWLFAVLFVCGAGLQIAVFRSFASVAFSSR